METITITTTDTCKDHHCNHHNSKSKKKLINSNIFLMYPIFIALQLLILLIQIKCRKLISPQIKSKLIRVLKVQFME